MKRIVIKYNPGSFDCYEDDISGTEEEWACNDSGCGIFSRRSDGSWLQHTGTCQAGPFRSPAELRRHLRRVYEIRNARVVEVYGWES